MNNKNKILLAAGGVGLLALLAKTQFRSKSKGKLSPAEFYKQYSRYAKEDERKTGVPAAFTLGQAALESNYGQNAYGNNFFGIKANPSWKGQVQKLRTWEAGRTGDPAKDRIYDEIIKIYAPGEPGNIFGTKRFGYRVRGKFRKYRTPFGSFYDHSLFLKRNRRYKKAFNYTDPYNFGKEVAAAGYATAPNYYAHLSRFIKTAENYA